MGSINWYVCVPLHTLVLFHWLQQAFTYRNFLVKQKRILNDMKDSYDLLPKEKKKYVNLILKSNPRLYICVFMWV